jgi:SAM-dependent methyltransferase
MRRRGDPGKLSKYVFGTSQTEQQRLVDQAEWLEPEARWLLDRIGIEQGWHAADIGCGPIGILNLLSERVGPRGAVIGVEREECFADMARAQIEKRTLSNAKIVQADALGACRECGPFDLVHERLVLINIAECSQKALVEQIVGLLKPGGTIALQDYDRVSLLCYPQHPSWALLMDAYAEAFRLSGGNGSTGRSLPWLLRSAGVRDVKTKVHVRTVDVGDSRRMFVLTMLDVIHDKILALNRFTEREFEAHREALSLHLSDPETLLIDRLLVQAWGRKPT